VILVDRLRDAEITVVDACAAAGISKSGYYASQTVATGKASNRTDPISSKAGADAAIVERIKQLRLDHPFWGYRRMWAWLRFRDGLFINKKRVYRLMQQNNLLLKVRPKRASRTPKSKPHPDRPNQYWGIDMTKFLIPKLGWVYLVIVLDWYSRKIVGFELSLRARRQEWEAALDAGLVCEFPTGVRDQGLHLVSDNGSQPTSTGFMDDMRLLDIEQIFTSYNNPKGNAETERVIRTIKEELLWLEEFDSLEEAEQKIRDWIERDYNLLYPHSSLGYRSPQEFLADCKHQQAAA